MKIVIDTNVFLVSTSRSSAIFWLYEAFLNEEHTLCVTTDILFEYEQVFRKYLGEKATQFILESILKVPNLQIVTRYFQWNLIGQDPNDNKFVDCAVAVGADALVTHDHHLDVLKGVAFPPVRVIDVQALQELLDVEALKV
jgi:putative PIN family toxin of toxin-antitoxin system